MSTKQRIYLDNNATTFLDPRVFAQTSQALQIFPGNPSSVHSFGQEAKAALGKARRTIADYLRVKPTEILFNSGATEGLNTILRAIRGSILTSTAEHACVYAPLKSRQGKVCFLETGPYGAVTPEAVKAALTPDFELLALMAVNNETGVKTDIDTIASIAQARGVPFLVDGVGLLGKESLALHPGISAVCFSGHKLHAPKGVGFTFIRSTFRVDPLLLGGEQEYGKRGGTENLAGIVGLAEAVRLLNVELPAASGQMQTLREKLEKTLLHLPGVHLNGLGPRICNTVNLSFDGLEGETLLTRLDMEGIAVSHGAACSSGALEPSRVLLNMGIPRARAETAIRFSLSRMTTEEQIDHACKVIVKTVHALRGV